MQISRPPHNWQVTPKKAIAIQKKIALAVRQTKPPKPFRYIAGVDAAFSKDGVYCLAGVVLWDMETAQVIECQTATAVLRFPYIPGLLSFREAPAIIAALRKLRNRPDALVCDGQGLAHPRGCGIATHIGILVDLPTIGCAKSRLFGKYQMPSVERGATSALMHKDKQVGTVLRTKNKVNPVFVSVGHRIDLATAEELILACARRYRLPEPTRLADQLVAAAKRFKPNKESRVGGE